MTSKQRILVTGSTGQLGSELKELAASYPVYQFIFVARDEFPLDDNAAIQKSIADIQPDYLINCAAYTAVDKAETEKEQAMQINGTAVGAIAEACSKQGVKFIHISTDYVFDGSSNEPLHEDAPVSPVNYYGESKLKGEQLATKANAGTVIIRTSWVYSFYGKNFVKTMMRLMGEKESIGVVGDQWGAPTYAADLAAAIIQIISSERWIPGIYHFSNDGIITWAQFASEIAALIQSSCVVNSIPTASYPTPAKRPLYSVMGKTKIQNNYRIEMKSWKESLQVCIKKLMAP
jgi:dTDP-4-dehydrorhamnose reductase